MGYAYQEKSSWYDDQPLDLGSGRVITRAEMKTLITDDLGTAIGIWKEYKRFGLHHGKGPEGESYETMMLINAFEDEYEDAVAEAANKAGN